MPNRSANNQRIEPHAAQLRTKIESSARTRRHEHFVRLMASSGKKPKILDLGGTPTYWQGFNFPSGITPHIVLLNTFPQQADGFISFVGDARDLSQFNDREFDIVFSNSVIGHVGGFADQAAMASEVQRVGTRFFVQTPNHSFPVDWRTLVPFFHFLPATAQAWCFSHLPVGTYKRSVSHEEARQWATRIRNIRRSEVSQLFPGARVIDERVCGFTKSFMIHNFPID